MTHAARPVVADGARAEPVLLMVGAAESAPEPCFPSLMPLDRSFQTEHGPVLLMVGAAESAP
jgi:hypothetical protein